MPTMGIDNLMSQESACRRELATLLAHIIHETGDANELFPAYTMMKNLSEDGCLPYPDTDMSACGYDDTTTLVSIDFPAVPERGYFGRGPIGMRWNGRYGQFGRAYHQDMFAGD